MACTCMMCTYCMRDEQADSGAVHTVTCFSWSDQAQAQTLLDTSPSAVGPLPRTSRGTISSGVYILSGVLNFVNYTAIGRHAQAHVQEQPYTPKETVHSRKHPAS